MLEPVRPQAVVWLTDLQFLLDCQQNFSLSLFLSLARSLSLSSAAATLGERFGVGHRLGQCLAAGRLKPYATESIRPERHSRKSVP